MNLTDFQQYGIAAIFIAIAIYLYRDMRIDKSATLENAKDREDRLMQTLEKQGSLMNEIVETLKSIDGRICNLEKGGNFK